MLSSLGEDKKAAEVISNFNELLNSLPAPFEFKPSFGGSISLDIKIGGNTLVPVSDSKEMTPVRAGSIVSGTVNPDVKPDLTSPTPGDLDNLPDWTEPGTATPAPASAKETPLQKALQANKAEK